MTNFLCLALLGLASVHAVAAAPVAEPLLPEIIPGPGWPSLAELNLTSAQLHAMPPPDEATRAEARALFARDKGQQGKCGPSDDAYGNVNMIITCYYYLRAVDEKLYRLQVKHGLTGICQVDKQIAVALSGDWYSNGVAPASAARDLAIGLLWIIDHCTRNAFDVAGQQAANGNGDMLVNAMRWGYYIDHNGATYVETK